MRVGLNLIFLEEHSGGAGTYARELIGALLEADPDLRLTAFVNTERPAWFDAQPWRHDIEVVELPVTVTHGPPHNFFKLAGAQWAQIPWRGRDLDVVHGLANVAPLFGRAASVVTILDLIWLRYRTTLDRRTTIGMEIVTRASARRADRVLAISHAARDDLIATLGVRPDRVDVTPLGARVERAAATAETELRERLGLGERPVVLTVGARRQHKNQVALVRALRALADLDPVLVLAGASGPAEPALRAAAEGQPVVICDWLSAADLEGLYDLAAVFALPSFEEGFGLPVLEAMARGVPVACSNTSSLPEVAGDAAVLFDPRDPVAVAAALRQLLTDPGAYAAAGRARAAQWTWRRTAEATLTAYNAVRCTSG